MLQPTTLPFNVVEVRRVLSDQIANELLRNGWILLSVASGHELSGTDTVFPVFGYCLARLREN